MKTIRLLAFVLLCLSATAVRGQEEIYDKYAVRDSLFVAYIQGYRIDSADRVDVIFIETKDSVVWKALLIEFSSEEMVRDMNWTWEGKGFATFMSDIHDPTRHIMPDDKDSVCMVVINQVEHTLCLFFLTDYQRQISIIKAVRMQSIKKAKEYGKERAKQEK